MPRINLATSKIKEPNEISSNTYLWESGTRYGADWSYIYYSVCGKTVQVIFMVREVSIGSLSAWSAFNFGRLPFGPAGLLWCWACVDRADNEGTQFSIDGNGNVSINARYHAITGSRGDTFRGCITFLINSYN